MRFKQAIQIGRSVEGIFRLPCVAAVRKDIFAATYYELYGFLMHDNASVIAREGNWICEDYSERWYLLTNEEYEQFKNTEE